MAKIKCENGLLLRDDLPKSISEMINFALEYFVFFRWIYFKNRPRANLLLIRSMMIMGLFTGTFFYFVSDFELVLAGIEIDPVIALFVALVIGHWNLAGTFFSKSASCNEVYLQYLNCISEGNHMKIFIFRNALALQLLTLDLWNHRLYRELFAKDLESSVYYFFAKRDLFDSPKIKFQGTPEGFIDRINKGKIKTSEAHYLLTTYQKALLGGDIEVVEYAA
ncbi:MAG: hypothetical protein AB8E15_03740 [Bdellovibrionales bacterium]